MWLGFIALGPIVHDGIGHDEDCAPALVLHDASRHQIGAAPPGPPHTSEHCAVCHLFCGSRYLETPAFTASAMLAVTVHFVAEAEARPVPSAASPLAARAPPAHS